MDKIREQIKFLKISGSVLPQGSACEEIVNTMEAMLKVVEAAKEIDAKRYWGTPPNNLQQNLKQALANLKGEGV